MFDWALLQQQCSGGASNTTGVSHSRLKDRFTGQWFVTWCAEIWTMIELKTNACASVDRFCAVLFIVAVHRRNKILLCLSFGKRNFLFVLRHLLLPVNRILSWKMLDLEDAVIRWSILRRTKKLRLISYFNIHVCCIAQIWNSNHDQRYRPNRFALGIVERKTRVVRRGSSMERKDVRARQRCVIYYMIRHISHCGDLMAERCMFDQPVGKHHSRANFPWLHRQTVTSSTSHSSSKR